MSDSVGAGFTLKGKTVLLVGATGGIGHACALLLDRLGATVHATGRNSERLADLKAALCIPEATTETLDLETIEAVRAAPAHWPIFDGVVFASGITGVKPLRAQPEQEFQRILRVNFEAPALLTRELLRGRRVADDGSMVFISSIAASIGAAGHTAYSASKAALNGFVRSLAIEVASRRIRVNTVSPGLVETAMADQMGTTLTEEQVKRYAASYPLGLGRPDDVAGAVAYLLCPASRWVTGTDLVVDGGVSHA